MTALEFQGGLSNNVHNVLVRLGTDPEQNNSNTRRRWHNLYNGNLGDITIFAGAIKSMNISGPLFVNGKRFVGKSRDDKFPNSELLSKLKGLSSLVHRWKMR